MSLLTYIENMEKRRELAAACGTSPDYLWQIATGWKGRKASHSLARKIEEATGGLVSRHVLRPDVFGPTLDGEAGEVPRAA